MFGRLPDGRGECQKGLLSVKRQLLRYGRGRLNELEGLVGDDYAVTGPTGKEGGAGAIGFAVFGVVVVNGGLFG